MRPRSNGFFLLLLAWVMLGCLLGCERKVVPVCATAQETERSIQMDGLFPAADPAAVGIEDEALVSLSESLAHAIEIGDIVGAELLGMKDSFYYTTATAADPRCERIGPLYFSQGSGYNKFWIPEEPLYPYAWGSQTLYSTPMDYARFLAMWMDGVLGTEHGFFREKPPNVPSGPVSLMTVMGGGMKSPTGFLGLEMHYGQMAVVYLDENGDTRVIGHSGSDGTLAWGWPKEHLMILVFTQSRGSAFWMSFESMIDQLFFHPDIVEMNRLAEESYAAYLGSYVDAADSAPREQTEIVVFNGALANKPPQGMTFVLEPYDSPRQWRYKLIPTERIVFDQTAEGNVADGFTHFSSGSSTWFERGTARPPIVLALEDVAQLLGTYLDVDADREIDVVFESGTLAVKIPEAVIPLALLPADDNGWWTMAVNPAVSIRFDLDSEGNVGSLTARSPEGETVHPRQARAR